MDNEDWIEIGHHALWRVTTAKSGNGIELMRDGLTTTFWQSEGHQPHLIDIHFDKAMPIVVFLLPKTFPFYF